MITVQITIIRTFAVALVLVLTATGLWAVGAEEEPAAAADKKYVTDPATGKVVSAPEYGGTITFAKAGEPPNPDYMVSAHGHGAFTAGVLGRLVTADWATPRDKHDFVFHNVPTNTIGGLAESWSQPDPLTYIVKVREGVHWHDKSPMNGRELTADDIEYNYHRILGLGSGFTERSERASSWKGMQFESITATDKWTVVFKLKELNLRALAVILDDWSTAIYPPEVIREHGDATDWRNLVGTGPWMLTDYVEGSSITWEKNPDYWGFDEKYPQNRLPYIDRLRALIMPEAATRLAALRTGSVDYMGLMGGTQMTSLDQIRSLQRTNPELVWWPIYNRSDNAFGMNVQLPPFDDIRVRKAMQMAINLEEINNAYYGGGADVIPQGPLTAMMTEVVTHFEDWPEDVKKVFDYDPAGAEALLDEAGYPRGADGIRFKTELLHSEAFDVNYLELVASYWNKIGVDVEIDLAPRAEIVARSSERDFEMKGANAAQKWFPMVILNSFTSGMLWNSANVDDPAYDAMYEAAGAATTLEEQNRIAGEMNQYAIEKFWTIWGPMPPKYQPTQPWVKGFNGEFAIGTGQLYQVFARLWIDSELKEAMGH